MKLQAANENLIVRMCASENQTTESGIIVSDSARGITYDKAEVISAGPFCKYARQGQIVFLSSGSHNPFKFGDEEFRIVNEKHVLAVLED